VTPFACSQARIDVSIEGRSPSALPRLAIEQGTSVSVRGAATPRAVLLALAALVLAAGAIRIHGITSRYPYMIYVDEGHVVHPASNMYRDRTLDPHHYWHNTLLMTAIDFVVRVIVQAIDDPKEFRARIRYHSFDGGTASNEEPSYGIVDPPIFLAVGRSIVAVCGSLTVLLMFLLLAELLPPWPALAGAAVFASIPVLVQYSHFVVGDIPMMLAYLAVYLATLRWSRTGTTAWLVASAVASGAACSFKMTGVLAAGFPLVHIALSRSPWRRKVLLSGLVVGLVYVSFHAFCPGLFGKDGDLIENLRFMNGYYLGREGSRVDHLLQLLDLALPGSLLFGFPLLALALAGGVGLLLDPDRRHAALPIVLYAVGFLALYSRNHYQPVRSMFPLVPLLLLLIAWGLSALLLRYWPRHGAAGAAAFLGVLAALCATEAMAQHRDFLKTVDSRVALTDWIATQMPQGHSLTVLENIHLHPDAGRQTGADIRRVPLADRDVLLNAEWVALPMFDEKSPTERDQLESLRRELIAQGRKVVWRRGNREVTADLNYHRPPRMQVQVYGPAPSDAPVR
jgi:hypothetical protein